MSEHTPGTRPWWIETASITASGAFLAIWLWDGPIFITILQPISDPVTASIEIQNVDRSPPTVADLLDAGCLTQEHLQAMREGRTMNVTCVVPQPVQPLVLLRDLPPEQRPFP